MPGNPKQKQKILYLAKILTERTGEQHAMTLEELVRALGEYGVCAERKSIYGDLKILMECGMDVRRYKSREVRYYRADGPSAEEVELLLELLRMSPQLPAKRRLPLERKLRDMLPLWRRSLSGQTEIITDTPGVTERVYSNVELLRDAIIRGKKVVFRYYSVLPGRNGRYRKGLAPCRVSPYRLVYADGYYLAGKEEPSGGLMVYRVENLRELSVTGESRTDIRVATGDLEFDLEQYLRGYFSPESGEPVTIRLRVHRSLMPVVDQRFSSDTAVTDESADTYLVTTQDILSPELISWLVRYGGGIQVVEPQELAEKMRSLSEELYETYHENRES